MQSPRSTTPTRRRSVTPRGNRRSTVSLANIILGEMTETESVKRTLSSELSPAGSARQAASARRTATPPRRVPAGALDRKYQASKILPDELEAQNQKLLKSHMAQLTVVQQTATNAELKDVVSPRPSTAKLARSSSVGWVQGDLHAHRDRNESGGRGRLSSPGRRQQHVPSTWDMPAHPASCVALGSGLVKAKLGQPSFVTVQLRSADNRNKKSGGDKLRVAFRGHSKASFLTCDNGDGSYFITFIVNISGTYEMDVRVGGLHINGSPFRITAKDGDSDADQTVCSGGAVGGRMPAGTSHTFTISTFDKFGQPRHDGGEFYKIAFTEDPVPRGGVVHGSDRGAAQTLSSFESELTDNGDGSYTVEVASSKTGLGYCHVLLGGSIPVGASPFAMEFVAGTLYLPSCISNSPSMPPIQAVAGVPLMSTFDIQAKDEFGNAMSNATDGLAHRHKVAHERVSGLRCSVKLLSKSTPSSLTVEPETRIRYLEEEEVYRVELMLRTAGKYSCALTSTERVSRTYGIGGKRSHRLKRLGDTKSKAGGLSVMSPVFRQLSRRYDPEAASGSDDEDGGGGGGFSSDSDYLPNHSPTLTVVCSPGETDPGQCVANGEGLRFVAGSFKPASFLVQSYDAFGNHKTVGGDTFDFSIVSYSEPVSGTVQDNDDGSYTMAYPAINSGVFRISVMLRGDHIPGSVFSATIVNGCTDAITTRISGPALGGGTVGEVNRLTIQAQDMCNNIVSRGGDSFTVDIRGPEFIEADVEDHLDGTYTATWTTKVKGHFVISVYLEDIPVAGSPFPEALWCAGPVHGPNCTVEGHGILGASTRDTSPATFTVWSRDAYGNPADVVDPRTFRVSVSGAVKVTPSLNVLGHGALEVAWHAQVCGVYHISVMQGGKHVRGSEFKAVVVSGQFNAAEAAAYVKSNYSNDQRWSRTSLSGGERATLSSTGTPQSTPRNRSSTPRSTHRTTSPARRGVGVSPSRRGVGERRGWHSANIEY